MKVLLAALVVGSAMGHGPEGYRDLAKVRPSRAGHEASTVTTMSLNYTYDGDDYEGYLAYPAGATGPLPAVMVVHQWYGLGENEMFRAEEAADKGYVGWAIDMYGAGRRASDNTEASELSGEVTGNSTLLLGRAMAGMEALLAGGVVDSEIAVNASAIAANGYCFGGYVCLAFGAAGADLVATAVFHPTFPNVSGWSNPDVAVQIHHGQNDFSGDDALYELQDQLTDAGVGDWSSAYYGGASHGFTDILSDAYVQRYGDQSHATAYAMYDALMPAPDTDDDDCVDDHDWYKTDEPSKNCDWVTFHAPRCQAVGFISGDRQMASEACPVACGTCDSRRKRL